MWIKWKRKASGKLHVALQYLPFEDRNNTTTNNNTAATNAAGGGAMETTTKSSDHNTSSAPITESNTTSNYVKTDAIIRKGKNTRRPLSHHSRRRASRSQGYQPDPYVKIGFGKQNENKDESEHATTDLGGKNLSLLSIRRNRVKKPRLKFRFGIAPLGRKQSLGTLRLHAGDILSQCLRVFKDTGEVLEKKFELANVSCGTLLIQFEFISVSQAPALEMDMEEAKKR